MMTKAAQKRRRVTVLTKQIAKTLTCSTRKPPKRSPNKLRQSRNSRKNLSSPKMNKNWKSSRNRRTQKPRRN